MARKDRGTLAERIAGAAEAALAAQDYVCCIDVMERIGWLYPGAAPSVKKSSHSQYQWVVRAPGISKKF